MHRKLWLYLWLAVPVGLLAFHQGPGKAWRALDQAGHHLEIARAAERDESWTEAVLAYDEALAALPPGEEASRQSLRLARANARLNTGELPEAMADLDQLLEDLGTTKAEPSLVRATREALASAQYHAAWLMRLEGADKAEWMQAADESRQNYRLLAEEAERMGDVRLPDHHRNLEATIRLAQMDLSELQGLPLPKKCQGCKNCSQKTRAQRQSKQPQEKKEPQDARKAGAQQRPPGQGS